MRVTSMPALKPKRSPCCAKTASSCRTKPRATACHMQSMNDAYLIPHPGRAVAPLSSTTARSSARRATPPENSLVDLGVAAVRVIALSTRMALSTLGALADAAGPLVRDPLVADVIALARTVGVEVVRAVGLAGVEEPADLLAANVGRVAPKSRRVEGGLEK